MQARQLSANLYSPVLPVPSYPSVPRGPGGCPAMGLQMSLPVWAQLLALALCFPIALALATIATSLATRVSRILWLRWRYRHIPGPPPHLLMGNFKEAIQMGGLHLASQKWSQEYGSTFKMFFMDRMSIVSTDPDIIHQMAFRSSSRPTFPIPTTEVLPKRLRLDPPGLAFANGNMWRMLRNAWQPAFAPGSLVGYTQPMEEDVQQLISVLSKPRHVKADSKLVSADGHTNGASNGSLQASTADDQYVNLHELFHSMTLDVVGTCAYGVKFNAVQGVDGQSATSSGFAGVGPLLRQSLKDFFHFVSIQNGSKYARIASIVPPFLPILRPVAKAFPDEGYTKLADAQRKIRDTGDVLMNDWRSRTRRDGDVASDGADVVAHIKMPSTANGFKKAGGLGGVEPGSFLGLLLEAQQKAAMNKSMEQLSDSSIAAQVHQFMISGTDTTANALTWAAYYLCQHPDKLERLLQEVDAHGRDKPTGPDDEYPYVMAVVNETLRMMPPLPSVGRRVDRPEGCQIGKYKVDCGVNVQMAVYAMHHDPKWWPRVEEFLPDRWLPEGEKELGCQNPNAYMPFGAGPRQCPGFKFALKEIRCALVSLYKLFTFEMKPGQVPLKPVGGISVSPRGGLWVKAVPRTPYAAAVQ